ncbi:amidohydrolase family protein [Kangiella sp. TOML190]|uniref:amidohydrolase family protein n=1 Tax=Kangiella sp. TOML190 TaxID=2931351 RepID=UPI00204262B9|nr:amidohydrolase family protein [Kangiella sp. TOML190]
MKMLSMKVLSKKILISLVIIVCPVLASSLAAQTLLIKNAKVHTLSSQGTLNNADILIEDGLIKSLGKNINSRADNTIDAQGKEVTPGIFAVANSIGLVEIDALNQTMDAVTADELTGASFSLEEAFNPNSTLVPHNRAQGVTRTLISPAYGNGHLLFGQGAIMSLSGDYHPVIAKSVAIFGSFGERASNQAGGSRATALKQLQTLFDESREYADNYQAILAGEYRELNHSIDDLKAMQAVIERKTPVVFNVNRASDIMLLLRFAKKNSIRIILKGAAEAWMVARDIARANVPVMLDPMNNIPASFESLGQRIDQAALLHKAGVDLIFLGQGFQNTHNAHTVRHSAGTAVSYGLPYDVALKAFTVTPARIFGGAESYGKIMPGYTAELVIWDGDPLEVTTSAEEVILAGKLVDKTTKASRLRERYQDISTEKNTAYRK